MEWVQLASIGTSGMANAVAKLPLYAENLTVCFLREI
jgi:hypothetical protein